MSIVKDAVFPVEEKKPPEPDDNKFIDLSRMAEEIKVGVISKATCRTCAHYMDIAKSFITGKTDKQIVGLAKGICKIFGSSFGAKDPSVCGGLVDSIGVITPVIDTCSIFFLFLY